MPGLVPTEDTVCTEKLSASWQETEIECQQGKRAAGDGLGGGFSRALRAHREVERFGVGVGLDAEGCGAERAGKAERVLPERSPGARADGCRFDEEPRQLGLWIAGSDRAEAGDLTIAFEDEDVEALEIGLADRELVAAGFHERLVVAPVGLRAEGEVGEGRDIVGAGGTDEVGHEGNSTGRRGEARNDEGRRYASPRDVRPNDGVS